MSWSRTAIAPLILAAWAGPTSAQARARPRSAEGGEARGEPWDAEAAPLIRLTDARGEVATARRPTDLDLPGHPDRDALHRQAEEADARLEDLQRTLARPRPFHFVVRPAAKEAP